MARLALEASAGRGDGGKAQWAFRDELIGLARDSAEASWRELRRGVDDLDASTRPDDQAAQPRRYRPYRVKS
jgi:hypothetical protein